MTTTPTSSLCVFCGARDTIAPYYREAATTFGTALAQNGIRLIFGGGNSGLMGDVANAVMAAGGEVIGVFPEHLGVHEVAHKGLTKIHLVASMHERKKMMFDLSDMFAVLPGGFGTMDEVMEILTWRQIGLHTKPTFFFNQNGYWNPLIEMMEKCISEQFARPSNRDFFEVHETLEPLLDGIFDHAQKKLSVM